MQMTISDPISINLRRRSKKRMPLTVAEKITIVHQVLLGKETQAAVAKEHRVSAGVVSILCNKVKKEPLLLDELVAKRDEAQCRREKIASLIQEKNDGMLIIDSSA